MTGFESEIPTIITLISAEPCGLAGHGGDRVTTYEQLVVGHRGDHVPPQLNR